MESGEAVGEGGGGDAGGAFELDCGEGEGVGGAADEELAIFEMEGAGWKGGGMDGGGGKDFQAFEFSFDKGLGEGAGPGVVGADGAL